jgi:hypothetical protein
MSNRYRCLGASVLTVDIWESSLERGLMRRFV